MRIAHLPIPSFLSTPLPPDNLIISGEARSTGLIAYPARKQALLDPSPRINAQGPDTEQVAAARRHAAKTLIGLGVDVRAMTPREASDVGLQLYAGGMLAWDEYAELAFQPELHPDYDATIGALVGENAAPDTPRDFVEEWTERVAYEQRYNAINSPRVKAAQRILAALGELAGERDSVAV